MTGKNLICLTRVQQMSLHNTIGGTSNLWEWRKLTWETLLKIINNNNEKLFSVQSLWRKAGRFLIKLTILGTPEWLSQLGGCLLFIYVSAQGCGSLQNVFWSCLGWAGFNSRLWIRSGMLDILMFSFVQLLEGMASFKGDLSNGRCMVETSIQSNLLPLHKSQPALGWGKHALQMQNNQGQVAERGQDYLRALIQLTKKWNLYKFSWTFLCYCYKPTSTKLHWLIHLWHSLWFSCMYCYEIYYTSPFFTLLPKVIRVIRFSKDRDPVYCISALCSDFLWGQINSNITGHKSGAYHPLWAFQFGLTLLTNLIQMF